MISHWLFLFGTFCVLLSVIFDELFQQGIIDTQKPGHVFLALALLFFSTGLTMSLYGA